MHSFMAHHQLARASAVLLQYAFTPRFPNSILTSCTIAWQLETAAVMAAEGLAAGTLKVKRGEFKGMYKMIEDAIVNYSFARDYVFKTATQQVMKASGGLYPAPLKILEIVKKNAGGKKFCTTAVSFRLSCHLSTRTLWQPSPVLT